MKLGKVIRDLTATNKGMPLYNQIPYIDMNNFFGGTGIRLKTFATKDEQLSANVGWAYAANQAIADEASAVKIRLYKKLPDGDREEIFEHELLSLIKKPNDALSGAKLWNLYYQYMNLTGEAYILKLRNGEPAKKGQLPHALHILPSHITDLQLTDSLQTSHVVFLGKQYPLESVIRDLTPDPRNIYRGRSIIEAAAETLDTEYQMKNWNRSLFANSGRPSSVIEVPEVMQDDAYKRLKQQMEEAHSGSDNAFKQIILEGGAKLAPYMMSQQDLDFLQSRKFSKDEIFAMFRVSPSIVGMTENVNRANAEAQDYTMAKRVTVPRVKGLVELLNTELVEPYDPTLEFDFDNPVPEDAAQALEEDKAGVDNWLTIDEVREKRGLPPLPNGMGATLYRPLAQAPIQMLGTIPTSNDTEDGAGSDENEETELSQKKKR